MQIGGTFLVWRGGAKATWSSHVRRPGIQCESSSTPFCPQCSQWLFSVVSVLNSEKRNTGNTENYRKPQRNRPSYFSSRLATAPLRFAITLPPSDCEENFHLQAIEHARHTKKREAPWRLPDGSRWKYRVRRRVSVPRSCYESRRGRICRASGSSDLSV